MLRKLFTNGLSLSILMLFGGYMAYAQDLKSMDIGDAKNNPGSTKIKNGTYTIKWS